MKKRITLAAVAMILVIAIGGMMQPDSFDPAVFQAERIQADISRFVSDDLSGRQAGTEKNKDIIQTVQTEFEAAGLDVTTQSFKAQIPFFSTEQTFSFFDAEGNAVSLSPNKDYKLVAWGPGGSADYSGDLIFTDDNPYKFPEGYFEGKIVVMSGNPLIGDSLQELIDAGVKGVLYYTGIRDENTLTAVNIQDMTLGEKPGDTIIFGTVTQSVFAAFKRVALAHPIEPDEIVPAGTVYGYVPDVTLNQTIAFETVETANVLGVIPGKDRSHAVIIAAGMDDSGVYDSEVRAELQENQSSGLAGMLELARMFGAYANEGVQPKQTVIFAALNAETSDSQGTKALLESGMSFDFSAGDVQVLRIDQIGDAFSQEDLGIAIDGTAPILVSRYNQVAEDLGFELASVSVKASSVLPYEEAGIPAVVLGYGNVRSTTYLASAALGETLYPQNPWQVLTRREGMVLVLLAVYLYLMYAIALYRDKYPALALSTPIQVLRKAGGILTPIVILLVLIMLTKLPRDFDVAMVGGLPESNFSLKLTLEHTLSFLRNIKDTGGEWAFIVGAFLNSAKLFGLTSIIAFVLGLGKGLFDAYSEKNDSALRSFTSLAVLSVPEILWILLANLAIIAIGKVVQLPELRTFFFPLMILSIMPTVYVSRMAYLAFSREKEKPYCMALRSRGIPKIRLYLVHLMPPAVESALTALLGLASVLISNMIVIEYLFDYKGLANFVLIADKTKDSETFIYLIAAISILYLLYTAVIKGLLSLNGMGRNGGERRV